MRYSCGHGHDPSAVACPVCMVEVRERARKAAQILIDAIGSVGPENVEDAAVRAATRLATLTRDLASARTAMAEAKGGNAALAEYVAASLAWWLDESEESERLEGEAWERFLIAYYALPVEMRRGK